MPARIKRRDTDSQKPPRKRRRVSVDAEVADTESWRRFGDADVSERPQTIPKQEFISNWFTNAGWCRQKTPKKMSQLPSPDATARSFSRAATTSSQRSASSVSDPDYRGRLEQYNVYIMEQRPPPGFLHEAERIVFRQRESPELDDAAVEQLRDTMRDLQNKGEEEVRIKLGAYIIPGYSTPSDKRLEVVHGQLWNKAVPVPPDGNALEPPLPLPKSKPDTTFAYSKAAFNRSQLATMNLLVRNPNGPSFASPCQDVRFPFAVIEYKSQAKDGSIRVATNQAAGAGAVASNGFLELISRGSGLDAADPNKPLFFSVTMDQNSAYINVEWIGKTSDTNQHAFHLEELRMLPLKYGDSIQVLQRALKNIHDYAADDLLKLILHALDEYRNKIKKESNPGSVEKPQTEAEPRAPPSPPPPPRSKRARGAAAIGKTTPQSKQDVQSQARDERPGVRTRRTAHVDPE
ncbi:MAG: hypothetical protein L6R38_002453 [Xanthoria sp. 2 TBL-2021]|nr:MAG: hypothetical protein L6R38_002453 [Xanthoria sp. 2 TBL-2021]